MTVAVQAAATHEDDHEPWGVLIDSAAIPGGGRLQLYRHNEDYEILFGEEQLMSSWAYRSEEALATLVADRLARPAERILIGGLGMGFTLGAALSAFPAPIDIVVAELVPQVIAWARGPLAGIFGDSLSDPRVSIQTADVHDMIVAATAAYDAILLDVDNGPDGLIQLANDRLYCDWGLRAARNALRPGGILAVWSAYLDDTFSARLQLAGFEVELLTVESGGCATNPPHVIWLASQKPALLPASGNELGSALC